MMFTGKKILELFKRDLDQIFGLSLGEVLAKHERDFWVVGLDEGRGTFFTDLLRNVDEPSWRLFSENAPRTNTDAGMLTNLRSRLPKLAKDADVFLINVVHLRKGEALLRPLIIHEICHYVEKIGHATNVPWHVNDEKNADTIIAGLDPPVRQLHSFTWARLLAYSGRFVVRNRLVVQGTVRQFLELAIPDYDRPQWDGGEIVEPT